MNRLGTYYGFINEDQEPSGPMIKWTLNRDSEENSIVASGTRYYSGHHEIYTITGTTGLLEGGKMQVDLKVAYMPNWRTTNLAGHFNLEENSIKGTITTSEGAQGEFVFKRHPDFVRFYPAPSIIDAKERWKFAMKVIRNRIQRESWNPSYILKRIKDGKRYMDLAIRRDHYGRKLDENENDEYDRLFSSLYESDVRFYASLIKIKLGKVPIQYVDSCLQGSRSALI